MQSKLKIEAQGRNVIVQGTVDNSDGYHVAAIVSALFTVLGVKSGHYADFAKAVEDTLGDTKTVINLNALKEQL